MPVVPAPLGIGFPVPAALLADAAVPVLDAALEPVLAALLAPAALLMLPVTFRITISDSIPGIRLCPSGSPVIAGLRPIRAIIPSIFRPIRANATTNIVHGIMARPVGTTDMAERINFKKTILNTIIRHMLANILTQPLKMSVVFLLPPIAKASGERMVNTETITYRSPISKKSLTIWTIRITPTMIARSQLASPGTSKAASSKVGTCTISGT